MDQYPHNGVPATNLNESDAELLLTGLYYIIQNKPTVNGYLTGDVIGGDLVRGGATGLTDPKILIADLITPEGGFVSGPWNGYMTALYQVNSLLVSLNKMAPSESVNRMLGTASFFRGFALLQPRQPVWRGACDNGAYYSRCKLCHRGRGMGIRNKQFPDRH